MRPHGRVLRVRVVEGGGKGPRHENATLGSCFHVWGVGNIRVRVRWWAGKGTSGMDCGGGGGDDDDNLMPVTLVYV